MSWEEQERAWRQTPEAQQMTEWERQQFLAHAKTGRAVEGLGAAIKWLLVALAVTFIVGVVADILGF